MADLVEQGASAFEAAILILLLFLKAELAEREVRSIAYQIQTVRIPPTWTCPGSLLPIG